MKYTEVQMMRKQAATAPAAALKLLAQQGNRAVARAAASGGSKGIRTLNKILQLGSGYGMDLGGLSSTYLNAMKAPGAMATSRKLNKLLHKGIGDAGMRAIRVSGQLQDASGSKLYSYLVSAKNGLL